jgi:TIR domain
LLRFINRFVPNTKMIEDLHPAELVAELAKRWQKRRSERSIEDQEDRSADAPKASDTPIFLSYANEDFEVADRVRALLEGVPLPVWMDKGKQREHRLNPGDIYDKKIREVIRKCSFFMPLLSRNTNELGESYFRREWGWALERLPNRTGNESIFIIPVIVDGLAAGELDNVPEAFKKTHIWRLPNGERSEDFCSTVKTHYRDFKSAKR